MTLMKIILAFAGFTIFSTAAYAECTGSNGRGWARGNGNGSFVMTSADKVCQISFPNFIDDARKTSIPASELTLTRAPASGKITLSNIGPVYTPNPGFKGQDRFCTTNRAAGVRGTLSGCVTVTVN